MDSDSTMSQSELITKLRRRRGVLLGRLKHVDRQIDECEQAGDIDEGFITSCRQTVDELGSKINNIQDELDELEEPETESAEAAQYEHIRIRGRIMELVKKSQSATHPTPRGSLSDIRNVSPNCNLTTITLAASVSQQPNSTVSNALSLKTSTTRNASPTRDLKIDSHDSLDQKELNPV
jgi:ElaB/YqjD/DUF883 family membrane-anchored ribosome-binding protein